MNMSSPMRFPVTAYVLRVSADRGERLFQTATEHWEWPVSQPIPRIPVPSRQMPIVVFASFQEDNITHIADGTLGPPAGTGLVQLKLHELDELTRPFPFSEIESRVPAPGPLPPAPIPSSGRSPCLPRRATRSSPSWRKRMSRQPAG